MALLKYFKTQIKDSFKGIIFPSNHFHITQKLAKIDSLIDGTGNIIKILNFSKQISCVLILNIFQEQDNSLLWATYRMRKHLIRFLFEFQGSLPFRFMFKIFPTFTKSFTTKL